ncbi:MAG: transporter substrate-binding protein, partial [Prochlorococcaceae cyanobacterium]
MVQNLSRRLFAGLAASAVSITLVSCGGGGGGDSAGKFDGEIKVGILHSLSGTMAISETTLKEVEEMAIKEINDAGGVKVSGKSYKIVPVIEDGASDWPTFAEKSQKLIDSDKVAVVFGGWTSASRKAMLPVFEAKNHMLFYPIQYEGQECSRNIF